MSPAKRRSFRLRPNASGWAKYAAKFPDRAAFYQSQAWKRARFQQLSREPNCRVCGQPATAVDHVIPMAEGGADLDPANLQSLCKRHHGKKTVDESHRGMKRAAQQRKSPP